MRQAILKAGRSRLILGAFAINFLLAQSAVVVNAQTPPEPSPGPARNVSVPRIGEFTLPNGLKVTVVRRVNVPLVAVQLVMAAGAADESASQAGLAAMSASLLTKGTSKRSASQIASDFEFLGGSLSSTGGWSASDVQFTIATNNLEEAFKIFSESILDSQFPKSEVDLLKSQTIDGLNYNLSQPSFLGTYVASTFAFGEHPQGGTLKSLGAIDREAIVAFAKKNFVPNRANLILVGDVTEATARTLVSRYLARWKRGASRAGTAGSSDSSASAKGATRQIVRRILVVDLPDSGQASVGFLKRVSEGRIAKSAGASRAPASSGGYYSAVVLNSVLGGGYSSRLNQEIRIKRGLSYGANSSFGWRAGAANFAARTQTKNESAPEVASLIVEELKKLKDADVGDKELGPRKAVLTGAFGQSLETNAEIASQIAERFIFGLSGSELNSYIPRVNAVKASEMKEFANRNFYSFDVVIVGDYSVFGEELRKRFPDIPITPVKAAGIDVSALR